MLFLIMSSVLVFVIVLFALMVFFVLKKPKITTTPVPATTSVPITIEETPETPVSTIRANKSPYPFKLKAYDIDGTLLFLNPEDGKFEIDKKMMIQKQNIGAKYYWDINNKIYPSTNIDVGLTLKNGDFVLGPIDKATKFSINEEGEISLNSHAGVAIGYVLDEYTGTDIIAKPVELNNYNNVFIASYTDDYDIECDFTDFEENLEEIMTKPGMYYALAFGEKCNYGWAEDKKRPRSIVKALKDCEKFDNKCVLYKVTKK